MANTTGQTGAARPRGNRCLGSPTASVSHRKLPLSYRYKVRLAINAPAKRDGKWTTPKASELVPGDVMRLGDIIPAVTRLLDGDSVEVDQSALTGEPLPGNGDCSLPRVASANGRSLLLDPLWSDGAVGVCPATSVETVMNHGLGEQKKNCNQNDDPNECPNSSPERPSSWTG